MLKKLFALSDQGERELKHGIVATTIGHLCIMAPISLLMLVTMGLLNRLCGETELTMQPGVIVLMAAVLLLLIFITQWVQYNLTYKVATKKALTGELPWRKSCGGFHWHFSVSVICLI